MKVSWVLPSLHVAQSQDCQFVDVSGAVLYRAVPCNAMRNEKQVEEGLGCSTNIHLSP